LNVSEVQTELLRVPQDVQKMANCGSRPVLAAIKDGSLPSFKIGKFRMTRPEHVRSWIRTFEAAQPKRRARK
jgi:hypothetical protein